MKKTTIILTVLAVTMAVTAAVSAADRHSTARAASLPSPAPQAVSRLAKSGVVISPLAQAQNPSVSVNAAAAGDKVVGRHGFFVALDAANPPVLVNAKVGDGSLFTGVAWLVTGDASQDKLLLDGVPGTISSGRIFTMAYEYALIDANSGAVVEVAQVGGHDTGHNVHANN